MSTLTVNLPRAMWMSANRAVANRGMKARIVRDVQYLVQAYAREQDLAPITGRCTVTWTIHYPKGVRTDKGDPTNAHPTCKAILDGLVPRWLPDDGPRFVVSETYQRGENLTEPHWHRVVLELVEVGS